MAEGVKKAMEELKERFPDDLDYVVALDTTLPVTEGIKEIVQTLFEAMVLVILVVFLFLQNWRATLDSADRGARVARSARSLFFPLLGFSINTLSLFGLVLAIGLVVDDAIVVVEAVEHHIEHGMSPTRRDAQGDGARSPGRSSASPSSSPPSSSPSAFMGGIQGRLNKQFAVTIAISVLISAFNALTLSPALCCAAPATREGAEGPAGAVLRRLQPRSSPGRRNGYVEPLAPPHPQGRSSPS